MFNMLMPVDQGENRLYECMYILILILVLHSPHFGGDATPWLELRPCTCGLPVTGKARHLKNYFLSPSRHRPGEALNLPRLRS